MGEVKTYEITSDSGNVYIFYYAEGEDSQMIFESQSQEAVESREKLQDLVSFIDKEISDNSGKKIDRKIFIYEQEQQNGELVNKETWYNDEDHGPILPIHPNSIFNDYYENIDGNTFALTTGLVINASIDYMEGLAEHELGHVYSDNNNLVIENIGKAYLFEKDALKRINSIYSSMFLEQTDNDHLNDQTSENNDTNTKKDKLSKLFGESLSKSSPVQDLENSNLFFSELEKVRDQQIKLMEFLEKEFPDYEKLSQLGSYEYVEAIKNGGKESENKELNELLVDYYKGLEKLFLMKKPVIIDEEKKLIISKSLRMLSLFQVKRRFGYQG